MSKKELCLSDQKYYRVVLLFNHWFVSSSLRLQGLQHARLPCPSLSLWVCSNSCPFSRWCCLTISSFVSLFSFCLQSFPASVFSNESAFCIRWPKYWSLSISPSNEYSGLISFRIDWFDLLAVQGTLKSLLEHHSSKASILGRSAFFMVQLLAFLPRSNCLNFIPAVTVCRDFGAQENKTCLCFQVFPIHLSWSDGTRCQDLSFLNVEF